MVAQRKTIVPMIAGVLCAVYSLLGFLTLSSIFSLVVYAFLAVVLLMRRRGILLVCAAGAIALHKFCITLLNLFAVSILGKITALISFVAIAFIFILALYDYGVAFPNWPASIRRFWFLPGAISVVLTVFNILFLYGWNLRSLFNNTLNISLYFLLPYWIVYPIGAGHSNTQPTNTRDDRRSPDTAKSNAAANDGYCDLLKHILLLLFTFGIWYFVWIYRTTIYLNRVEEDPPRNPTNKLLLCIFVPFYSIYWIYQSAQRLDRLANSKGISSDLTTLCLILAIFVGVIPPILMQEKINTIANLENGIIEVEPQQQRQSKTVKTTIGAAEELKTYKELLDSGVITQEEFDAKKKQLLGL